ncbi:hypothetical protein SCYAM73S_01282 [Streptomyces cyaneofuscatus]
MTGTSYCGLHLSRVTMVMPSLCALGDQYPVEGVAVQRGQPARPNPVSRGDRQ